MVRRFRSIFLVAALLPFSAGAQTVPDDVIRAEVIGGWQTDEGTHMAALRLTMADGWHTYWRSPGEAGIPPQFNWDASGNIGAVALHWPIPQVFDLNGTRTLGYEGELVLPVEITQRDTGEVVTIDASLDLGVCDEICVPVSLRVSADLPVGGEPDQEIASALADRPADAASAGLKAATCSAEPIRDGLRLTARVAIPSTGTGEFGVVELDRPGTWVSGASTRREGGTVTLVADLVPPDAKPFVLDRSAVRITLFGGSRAVDIRGCTG